MKDYGVLSFELSATAGFLCLPGDWKAWLDFFAEAVIVFPTQAVYTTKQLIDLASENLFFDEKIDKIQR